ncbi:hypothetical protein [Shewanella woodyi]|uniref:hypothetical protein n=1 Tax=Shewanella woodyi TaxID=60961 RepID=UPI003749B0D1
MVIKENLNQWLACINPQLKLNKMQCHILDENGFALRVQLSANGELIAFNSEMFTIETNITHHLPLYALELNAQSELLQGCYLAKHENKLVLMHHLDTKELDSKNFENTLNNFLVLSDLIREKLQLAIDKDDSYSGHENKPQHNRFLIKG